MRETEQDNKVRYIIITFDGIYLYVYSAYIYIKPFLHNVRKMSHSPGIVNQTLHHVRSIRSIHCGHFYTDRIHSRSGIVKNYVRACVSPCI